MIARLAKPEELEYLQGRLKESGLTYSHLGMTPCVVTDSLTGMLPIRLLDVLPIWHCEPLLVFPEVENINTRRRTMYLLWKEAERWIASGANCTGITRYLAVTHDAKAKQLFEHAGLTKLDSETARFFSHLAVDEGSEFYFREVCHRLTRAR